MKTKDFDDAGNFIGKKDDLTKVEGIGPKVQSHLNGAGIYTWNQLANTEVNKIKAILEAQGGVYANNKELKKIVLKHILSNGIE